MTLPISALQRNAAAAVRRVRASGIAEEITDRGRVVAILAPPPGISGLDRLLHEGALHEPEPGGLMDVLPDAGALGDERLMEALLEQRDSER